MAIINLEMIGQMIGDHDCDRRLQDFEKVIMSDCGSQFCKIIVSDRGSQKKWSNLSLPLGVLIDTLKGNFFVFWAISKISKPANASDKSWIFFT